MLEILLWFRRPIRIIGKIFGWIGGLGAVAALQENDPGITIFGIIMAAVCMAAVIGYDRMLFKIARKKGYDLYLK